MASFTSSRRTAPGQRNSRSSAGAAPLSLGEQLGKIFRHPLIIVAGLVIGAVLGALASMFQTPSYQATSTVVVYPLTVDPNAQASNQIVVDIDTEASVAGSQEVARVAAANLDSSDSQLAPRLNSDVSITPHSGTAILDFVATADSAEEAANYANSVADAYLQVREESLQATVDETAENIRERISSTSRDDTATRQVLQERLGSVEVTSTTSGRVITEAKAPSDSENLDLWKYLLVGAVAGLLVGAVVAAVVDSRNRRLKYFDRAADIVEQPVHRIRSEKDVEDARRLLLALGTDAEAGKNLLVYSPTEGADRYFTDLLEQAGTASGQAVALGNSEISTALAQSRHAGLCLVAVTPETSVTDLREFAQATQAAEIDVEYVYLQK